MRRFAIRTSFLLVPALLPASGCIIIADLDPWNGGCARVWVDGETQRISLDGSHLSGVDIRTHNGAVNVEGASAGDTESFVDYRIRTGAFTLDGAREALDAVEVFVDNDAEGIAHIGWRWRVLRHRSWHASVRFDVHAPQRCDVKVRSHNGHITTTSLSGRVDVVTHNGSVSVQTTGDQLRALTHNGKIDATFAGRDITLVTHNGRIAADVTGCRGLDGRIVTHNGRIRVTMGAQASTVVQAATNHGTISCAVPLEESTVNRHALHGRVGDGDGSLTISSYNGGIQIENMDG